LGNTQDIRIVFQQVVDEHFGSFIGIEKLAKEQQEAYKRKVKRSTWLQFKAMFTWQTNLFVVAMFTLGFYLPQSKLTAGILMGGLVLLSFYLWFYSLWLGRFNRVQKGKRSITDIFIARQGFLPAAVLNSLINLPNLYNFIFNEQDYQYKLVAVHPAVMTITFGITLIYCLACIETGKKEFSIKRTA
jgi:hypothetical protein